MRVMIRKIKRFLAFLNQFNTRYQVPRNSASLSFYMLISLISILTIAIQIFALSNGLFENFLIPKVINIFSDNFSEELLAILPSFSLSGFSVIVLINLFWGASKTINAFNRMADYIYYQIKPRNDLKSRISAFLMFSMLILVIIFEVIIIFSSNYLIEQVLKIHFAIIIRTVQFVIELLMIFFTLLILYMYAPPIKMRIKDAYKGALFSTLLIYLIFGIFLLLINAMKQLGIGYSIITILSFSLLILYNVNYIIISGMILNYFGNIFQIKSSLFRKQ